MLRVTTEMPVKIERNGAIVLWSFSIDGCGHRKYRVVTHGHADHYKHVLTSSKKALRILATKETFAILEGLGILLPKEKLIPVKPGYNGSLDDYELRVYTAEHIPGSISVEISDENIRIGYTGDFKLEGTEIIEEPDILVLDATYGSPNHVRKWSNNDVLDEVLALYRETKGQLWIYGYYGKIQGVLRKLREAGYSDPVLMTSRMYKVTRNLSETGFDGLGEFYLYGTREARDLFRGKVIIMDHVNGFYKYRKTRPGVHVLLNGWEFRKPLVRLDSKSYIASYSDHSDFQGTIEYVRESKPKIVLVDGSRSEYARFFAYILRKKLDVEAYAMPSD
ncbi:MAG: MBL fold metallo-hydrolase [Desulfurococcales archaeon]|nr:MBL fold metallo-hydrolase [Desulfurococcales archaeon]